MDTLFAHTATQVLKEFPAHGNWEPRTAHLPSEPGSRIGKQRDAEHGGAGARNLKTRSATDWAVRHGLDGTRRAAASKNYS